MVTRLVVALMMIGAIAPTAQANWFANPSIGINLHIGSAPNPKPEDVVSGRRPVLVRDADGNVIAMIDPLTGKVIAIAEPPVLPKPLNVAAKPEASSTRAR